VTLGAVGWFAGGIAWGGGVVAGAYWALANLALVRFLVVRWLRTDRPRGGPQLGLVIGLLVKFPLLYLLGYLMLASGRFRIEALVIGFTLPFVAALIDALAASAADRSQAVAR
jgi:tellurite resistance protein TehA-like permease